VRSIAFKQRIIGAIFILALGVILIPVILDSPSELSKTHYSSKPSSPGLPEVSEVSKINYVFNEVEQVIDVAHEEVVAEVAAVEPFIEPEPEPLPVPVAKPTVTARVEKVATTPALGDWTIQLGAFSSTENANELLQRLSKEGFQSYLKGTPGGKIVRVFVAPGIDKTAAQDLVTQLDAEFGIKGIVVRYREQ